jgi:hypothetical protein
MRKTRFALFLVLIVCKTHAQQDNLVLIDAENVQPFYARIGERIFNSSSIGHLSIPHLRDSTYLIDIGFPDNLFPEKKYSIKVNRKDQGFQLKNLGEKGWALYNWQTQEMRMPISETHSETHTSLGKAFKKDDPFSRLMAAVVNDSSVMYDTYSTSDQSKKDSAKAIISPGAVASADNLSGTTKMESASVVVKSRLAAETMKDQKAVRRVIADPHPGIVKYNEELTDKELRLVYVDVSIRGFADTISIIIPKEQETNGSLSGSNAEKKNAKTSLSASTSQALAGGNANTKNNKKKSIPLPKCKSTASDYDIDVLRLNILTERTIDKRIAVAKKYFSAKCISTSQVRTLTELFDEDKDKFDFFRIAYPRVTDRENFNQLSVMLKGSHFIDAFNEEF